jgi:hypothetical protein
MRGCAAVMATVAVLGGASCSQTVRTGQSPAYLIIERIIGTSGADDSLEGSTLTSDVETIVERNSVMIPVVFEDHGSVIFRLALKDVTSAVGPTDNNVITINRYRVSYRRTDGRNTPGVDVPWPFEGAATATVTERTEMSFMLVRLQAKKESPLIQLARSGGAIAISTIADVTFFGHDQTGRDVSVTGSISVNFADWADPEN